MSRLILDIKLSRTRTVKLEIRDNDNNNQLARRFSRLYGLDSASTEVLSMVILQSMEKNGVTVGVEDEVSSLSPARAPVYIVFQDPLLPSTSRRDDGFKPSDFGGGDGKMSFSSDKPNTRLTSSSESDEDYDSADSSVDTEGEKEEQNVNSASAASASAQTRPNGDRDYLRKVFISN